MNHLLYCYYRPQGQALLTLEDVQAMEASITPLMSDEALIALGYYRVVAEDVPGYSDYQELVMGEPVLAEDQTYYLHQLSVRELFPHPITEGDVVLSVADQQQRYDRQRHAVALYELHDWICRQHALQTSMFVPYTTKTGQVWRIKTDEAALRIIACAQELTDESQQLHLPIVESPGHVSLEFHQAKAVIQFVLQALYASFRTRCERLNVLHATSTATQVEVLRATYQGAS